jgi:hypothetical protein
LNRGRGRPKIIGSPAAWVGIFLCLFLCQMSWGLSSPRPAGAKQVEGLSYKARHIALSLRVLSQRASDFLSERSRLPGELSSLGGITRFRGFLIDDDNQDVILVGQQISGDASLHLDDLVVTMRSVWRGRSAPVFCSLDPRGESVSAVQQVAVRVAMIQSPEEGRRMIQQLKKAWGSQVIRVGGVPRDSRYAHVMIDADYHMKQVALGAQKLSGLPSLLDIRASQVEQSMPQGNGAIPPGPSYNRFWFTVGNGFPTFTENEGIVWVKACPIVLFTEKQIAGVHGELYDTEEEDPASKFFAQGFSDKFPWLAEQVPYYAELRNLYLLKAVLESMHFRQAFEKADLSMGVFLDHYAFRAERPMPDSLEGRVLSREVFVQGENGNKTHWHFPVAFGGVNMEMDLREGSSEVDRGLMQVRCRVLQTRPSPETLSW